MTVLGRGQPMPHNGKHAVRRVRPATLPGWGEMIYADGSTERVWMGRGGRHALDDLDAYLDTPEGEEAMAELGRLLMRPPGPAHR